MLAMWQWKHLQTKLAPSARKRRWSPPPKVRHDWTWETFTFIFISSSHKKALSQNHKECHRAAFDPSLQASGWLTLILARENIMLWLWSVVENHHRTTTIHNWGARNVACKQAFIPCLDFNLPIIPSRNVWRIWKPVNCPSLPIVIWEERYNTRKPCIQKIPVVCLSVCLSIK